MNLKIILLLCFIYFVVCTALKTTKKVTTKKATKKVTTTKSLNKISTSSLLSNAKRCYNGTAIYTSRENYSLFEPILCATYCYASRIEIYDQKTIINRGCQIPTTDKALMCPGYLFSAYISSSLASDCCEKDLCNNDDFAKKSLTSSKCEDNKDVTKSMKLIYPVRNFNLPSVQKCYYCMYCTDIKKSKTIDCFTQYPDITNFACQYYYVYIKNGTKTWNADCIDANDMIFITYKKIPTKLVSCQSDLCNNPATLNRLENYTLCKDGYYSS